MKIFLTLFAFFAATAQAAPFAGGNVEAGKKFFDQNQCYRCHIQMLGGDGSKIFTRVDHKVKNPQQLVEQMHFCSVNAGIVLTPADEQNLGAYLNQKYYRFK